jgi:hypothetical protein
MVTAPSSYSYVINDMSGSTIMQGQVTSGSSSIETNYLSSGTYVIRFANGSDQYVEKFVKR